MAINSLCEKTSSLLKASHAKSMCHKCIRLFLPLINGLQGHVHALTLVVIIIILSGHFDLIGLDFQKAHFRLLISPSEQLTGFLKKIPYVNLYVRIISPKFGLVAEFLMIFGKYSLWVIPC